MLDNLSPEHSQYIVAAIASGRYQSEAEALKPAHVGLLRHADSCKHAECGGRLPCSSMLEIAERQAEAGLCKPAEEVFDRLEQRRP